LYVEATGNDGTGTRGNQGYPYLTIAHALTHAQNGDTIKVGIGSFAEALTLPELASISIVGSGINETTITSADATATIGANPAVTALQTCTISNMTVANTGAGLAIGLDGTGIGAPGIFVTGSLILDHVYSPSGDKVMVQCAGFVFAYDCIFGLLDLNEVDSALFTGCYVLGTAKPQWNPAATLPVGVSGSHKQTFIDCKIGTLNPTYTAQVDKRGGHVTTTTTDFTEDGAVHGKLTADGELGAVTIVADSVANVDSADLRGATMSSLTVTSGGGGNRVAVDVRGATATSTVTANALTDIDIRDGSYGALASAGDGTINRTHHTETVDMIAGDTPKVFTVPFPDPNYVVEYERKAAGLDPFTPSATKLATGFICTAAGICNGNIAIITHP
jgi:hypothetical protein